MQPFCHHRVILAMNRRFLNRPVATDRYMSISDDKQASSYLTMTEAMKY